MSWASKMVGKARRTADSLGKDLGLGSTERKYFRYGVASMGGGMALQNEYSKNKGMSDDEAFKNSVSGGAQYSEARGMQKARVAEDAAAEQAYQQSVQLKAQERAARLASEVRIRRRGMGNLPGNKGGTLLTGALGLLGGTSSTLGA